MGVVELSSGMLKLISDELMNEMQIAWRLAMATIGDGLLLIGRVIMIAMMPSTMTLKNAFLGLKIIMSELNKKELLSSQYGQG